MVIPKNGGYLDIRDNSLYLHINLWYIFLFQMEMDI